MRLNFASSFYFCYNDGQSLNIKKNKENDIRVIFQFFFNERFQMTYIFSMEIIYDFQKKN